MCSVNHFVAAGSGNVVHHGGLIHILLVVAIIVVLVRVIQGRKI